MRKIRILHILSALDSGGVEQMLYNYYTHMDRQQIGFDFIVYSDKIGNMEAAFRKLGATIYHVTPKRVSFIKSTKEIAAIIRQGNYHAVHVHQGASSFNSLAVAKHYGVPLKIVHNHGVKKPGGWKKYIYTILMYLNWHWADWHFACSDEAGQDLFGKHWNRKERCLLMKNAVDLERYVFREDVRKKIRSAMALPDNAFMVLHAGRMDALKNQRFLLDVFCEVKKSDPTAILVLAGDGPLKTDLQRQAADLQIADAVYFVGVLQNLNAWYQAADVFVFPSVNEGLGMVSIEAQIAGLPVICSNGVPRSVNITKNVCFLPLSDSACTWSTAILQTKGSVRTNQYEAAKNAGYDIVAASQQYQNWIIKTVGVTK